MEYTRKLKAILNSNISSNRKYVFVEALLNNLISRELSSQDLEYMKDERNRRDDLAFDFVVQNGFNGYEGKTAIEIRFNIDRFTESMSRRLEAVSVNNRIQDTSSKLKRIIFVCIGSKEREFTLEKLQAYINDKDVDIMIWRETEIEKLILKHEEYFSNALENVEAFILDNQVAQEIKKNDDNWKDVRDDFIEELREKYNNDDIVLCLGAGASYDAKIPTWNDLLNDMFVTFLSEKLDSNNIRINDKEKNIILNNMMNINQGSPLLQARFIRSGMENGFLNCLAESLYKDSLKSSDLLREITKLCRPERNSTGIHAVITYNFDDLLEKNLKDDGIRYKSIYKEGDIPNKQELGIYHVHGYLPSEKDQLEEINENSLVFSEEGYHSLYTDSYHWSNLIQLNLFKEKTAVFIGLSLTDPNLRRLLDISARRLNTDGGCKHYALMLWKGFKNNSENNNNSMNKNIAMFERTTRALQENYFKELGVQVIWFENYNEVPEILWKIRNYE